MTDQANPSAAPASPEDAFRKMSAAMVPHMYFNGFAIAYGPADVTIFLNQNENVVGKLSLSHETLRSLRDKLVEGIQEFDKAAGLSLPSSDDISNSLQKAGAVVVPRG
ncbi:hypothetical protein [Paraburkholderia tuberum]|uniref:Uncharacterized protein n=1 Tax=Paraburkholderia tuberum TaxID=157910 RepID=A0A1H0ZQ12_9BURK|nr:hypothetical protein [Paraburkholderia tuberum]SDQ29484.1 hypothetical protein SAMN05445850_0154 [Paraburkholderia tuberum]